MQLLVSVTDEAMKDSQVSREVGRRTDAKVILQLTYKGCRDRDEFHDLDVVPCFICSKTSIP